MRIRIIPALQDNYSYLIIDDGGPGQPVAAVVDPSQAAPVLAALDEEGAALAAVLCTHYHWDHVGGVEELVAAFPGVEVLASAVDGERIAATTRTLADHEAVAFGGLQGYSIPVPCHTRGHIAFVFGDALFCGDTLFVGGCGRFFEGTAEQMEVALNQRFAELPDATRVFCGHEYTVSNLTFAIHVEPENQAVADKLAWARGQVAAGATTIPSTLGEERRFNPFMRTAVPSVMARMDTSDPVTTMAALREAKNAFKG